MRFSFSRAARVGFPHLALLNEPERAMRALRKILDYQTSGTLAVTEVALRLGPVARRLANTVIDGSLPLSEIESKELLREYGIKVPTEELATSAADAVVLAERIGYPVVLKGIAAEGPCRARGSG